MPNFDEVVVFISSVNGKHLALRKDIIDGVHEIGPATIEGKFCEACSTIITRGNMSYPVKENYYEAMALIGWGETPL